MNPVLIEFYADAVSCELRTLHTRGMHICTSRPSRILEITNGISSLSDSKDKDDLAVVLV
jgi:hypothetical protein